MKQFEKEIREFIELTSDADASKAKYSKKVSDTFNNLVSKYSYLMDERYYAHTSMGKDVHHLPDYSVSIWILNNKITEFEIDGALYTPKKITSPNERSYWFYEEGFIIYPNGKTLSPHDPYINISQVMGASIYRGDAFTIYHLNVNMYQLNYEMNWKYPIEVNAFFDNNLNMVSPTLFNFDGNNLNKWLNQKGYSFPLTDKQIYEFELKYI